MKNRVIMLAGLLLILSACTTAQKNKTDVVSTQVQQMLSTDPTLIVLDVRTPAEFSEGHIKGAMNIDMREPGAMTRINALDKNAAYIVYCRTGNRSGTVVNTMVENGFKTIYHMTDGITGWNGNGLPVEK
jgi:rhodanese-related sulfurtransferase